MKVDRSLGLRKFDSILMTSTFEMAIGVLISLSDTAVTGHIIGADGLSAMNIISPITGMTIFTENLIAVGTSMLYARRKGEYDDQGAGSAGSEKRQDGTTPGSDQEKSDDQDERYGRAA